MLQGQEILVILLVALVVLGPHRLPELARKLGSWTAELRKAAREIRVGLEAEVGDVKRVAEEFKAPMKDVTDTMADAQWVGPEPRSGPSPADAMSDLAEIEEKGRPLTDTPDGADTANGTEG